MTAHPSNGRDDSDAIAACVSRHPAAQTPHEERVADDILGVDPEVEHRLHEFGIAPPTPNSAGTYPCCGGYGEHFDWCADRRLRNGNPIHRFFQKVDMHGPAVDAALGSCWLWTGTLNPKGYGSFWAGDRMRGAHRWLYEAINGPIAAGLEVDHLCRRRECVNPSHLEAVTHEVNVQRAEMQTRTHCVNGHAFAEHGYDRIVAGKVVGRRCRACNRDQKAPAAEVAGDIEAAIGLDPSCRYQADPAHYPSHQCHRNTGELVRWGETCYAEARAQLQAASRVCLTCGERIPDGGCVGGAVVADGRSFSFHCGDCFAHADEAVAAFVEAHPLCGSCGGELVVLNLPSQRWCHETPAHCRMPFPEHVVKHLRVVH